MAGRAAVSGGLRSWRASRPAAAAAASGDPYALLAPSQDCKRARNPQRTSRLEQGDSGNGHDGCGLWRARELKLERTRLASQIALAIHFQGFKNQELSIPASQGGSLASNC